MYVDPRELIAPCGEDVLLRSDAYMHMQIGSECGDVLVHPGDGVRS